MGSGGDHFDPEFAVRVRLCCSGPALELAVEARRRKEEEGGGRRRKEEEGGGRRKKEKCESTVPIFLAPALY